MLSSSSETFDFSPFYKHHHHKHHGHHHHHHYYYNPEPPPPGGTNDNNNGHEIDPRYGVEKRLVPTGPNPLHH
ncbi:hypothetical protein MKW94_001855 [Papaver nudicaule]|uniref:Uncharacterized protein n=1 Tax=Papaver nudicaule TaxID=74823 RepID=A0AA41VZ46_PAPNU|nr:hypothetical protein [Papaver nudicaule]